MSMTAPGCICIDACTVHTTPRYFHNQTCSEPEFVNILRSPGIDSQPGGPVRQPYLAYRSARLHRLAESIPWNRFPGVLKRLQIRAL